jgi:hypothetical protein
MEEVEKIRSRGKPTTGDPRAWGGGGGLDGEVKNSST